MFSCTLRYRIELGISTKEEVVDFLQWCWRATEGKESHKVYAEKLEQMGSKPDSAAVGSGEGAGRTLPKKAAGQGG